MPGMMGGAQTPVVVPTHSAVSAAADFIAVAKLAASPDVQDTIARMLAISEETQSRIAAAQQVEADNAKARTEIEAARAQITADRQTLESEKTVVSATKSAAIADRQAVAKHLDDAKVQALQIVTDANATKAAAQSALDEAQQHRDIAKRDRDAATVDRANAAALKVEAEARVAKMKAAIGA